MQEEDKYTKHNSKVVSLRLHNDKYKRLIDAAKRTKQRPGEFARVAVINEIEYVENQ